MRDNFEIIRTLIDWQVTFDSYRDGCILPVFIFPASSELPGHLGPLIFASLFSPSIRFLFRTRTLEIGYRDNESNQAVHKPPELFISCSPPFEGSERLYETACGPGSMRILQPSHLSPSPYVRNGCRLRQAPDGLRDRGGIS
jgi:hypothetical protein